MSFTKAIYIQGCARSGTSLIRQLCVAGFRDAELVKMSNTVIECSLPHLIELADPRPQRSVLSRLKTVFAAPEKSPPVQIGSRDSDTSLAMDAKLLSAHPAVKVIWMLRDPRDVLTSIHARLPGEFYVKPERLIRSLELYRDFKDRPQVLTVRYMEIVTDANAVQARIAEAFQLESVCAFSEAHQHFPRDINLQSMHSVRPIDDKSVQKWRSNLDYKKYLEQVFAEHPVLVSLARECGYEVNLD